MRTGLGARRPVFAFLEECAGRIVALCVVVDPACVAPRRVVAACVLVVVVGCCAGFVAAVVVRPATVCLCRCDSVWLLLAGMAMIELSCGWAVACAVRVLRA